ncbi:MAG: alpha/beta hydrolase [Elusimicrobia bacterium]|nr:alpha/beta hydrolase [Elusimicrobiota bacterium]MDE2237775.1 alpha/beta hydrolase [Elusimicrobiota bacterium]MDE2425111.1 alpha/beta hydrolase [Elusimicrobiota bacterium]
MRPASSFIGGSPRLHLADWGGAGPPLLLVHGMGANSHWWDRCAPLLARRFRVAALDLSGHGDSEWRADGDYRAETWVEDIERARRALGWERFNLCGHSLGARLSLEYAARCPRPLSALALVDFLAEFSGGRFSRPRLAPQPRYPSRAAILKRFRLQPDRTLLSASALAALGRLSIRREGRSFTWKYDWRCFRYRYDPIWPLLPRLPMPTLLIRGRESLVMSAQDLRRAQAALPQARALELPDAHHHAPLDAPAALSRALGDFLAGPAGPAR